jgi:predicted Zn-dependent peptidase
MARYNICSEGRNVKALTEKVKIYEEEIEGLKVVFIKRKDISSSFGLLTVKFGSMFTILKIGDKEISLPDGVAHFLEHRLFEINGKDATELFSKFGADTNAFTGRKNMTFYFTTTSNFFDCMNLLLDLVFTEKSFLNKTIKREKLIIASEITMYDDEPYFLGYQNLVDAMFWFNPLKKKVAGTVDSIEAINPEILHLTYNAFFSKKNSILFILGDIDESELFDKIREKVKSYKNNDINFRDESFKYIEPAYPRIRRIELKSRITKNLVFIGFKPKKDKFSIEEIIASNLILEIIFGSMSPFYDSLFSKGLIDDSFNYALDWEGDYCCPIISSYTDQPDTLLVELNKEIERRLFNTNITEEELTLSKSNAIGGAYMLADNPSNLIGEISTLYLSQVPTLEKYIDILKSLNLIELNDLLSKLLPIDNSVTVTVKPY